MKSKQPIVVQKYGGSSMATTAHIRNVASLIKERRGEGLRLCVVVSAMGKTTDQLLSLAHEISPNPSRRELDMLLSCGERASMALLAMALHEIGVESLSLTGSQSGIITDDVHSGAKIIEVRPARVLEALESEKVAIVAGFQGVSFRREITTLGRGGSDTTAVALAAALGAHACEIYSDVAGVLSADPRLVPEARPLSSVSFDEMQSLASAGAKVLNAQAVEFAKARGITIHARKTGSDKEETLIHEDEVRVRRGLTAIAHQRRVHGVKVGDVTALPQVLRALSGAGIGVSYLAVASGAKEATLWISPEDAHGLSRAVGSLPHVQLEEDSATLSLIGQGLSRSCEILSAALGELSANAIAVRGIQTDALRTTLFIADQDLPAALTALHARLIEQKGA